MMKLNRIINVRLTLLYYLFFILSVFSIIIDRELLLSEDTIHLHKFAMSNIGLLVIPCVVYVSLTTVSNRSVRIEILDFMRNTRTGILTVICSQILFVLTLMILGVPFYSNLLSENNYPVFGYLITISPILYFIAQFALQALYTAFFSAICFTIAGCVNLSPIESSCLSIIIHYIFVTITTELNLPQYLRYYNIYNGLAFTNNPVKSILYSFLFYLVFSLILVLVSSLIRKVKSNDKVVSN